MISPVLTRVITGKNQLLETLSTNSSQSKLALVDVVAYKGYSLHRRAIYKDTRLFASMEGRRRCRLIVGRSDCVLSRKVVVFVRVIREVLALAAAACIIRYRVCVKGRD